MKTAILIHGWPDKKEYFDPVGPSSSNRHWFPWVQHQLILNGILAQTPEMPDAYEPDYQKWSKTFEQFNINEETLLIGHSCGAGFLIRWLSENNKKVGKVILVAPWLDPEGELKTGFFDFEIQPDLLKNTKGVILFYSTDDYDFIIQSVNILKEKLEGMKLVEFTNKRHFCLEDMGTVQFPELLHEALN